MSSTAYRGWHRFLHLIVCDRCGIKEPWERRQVILDHVKTCSLSTANCEGLAGGGLMQRISGLSPQPPEAPHRARGSR